MINSKEKMHAAYMLNNDLGIALQSVVRTDYEIWRKPLSQTRVTNANDYKPHKDTGTKSSSSRINGTLLAIRNHHNQRSKVDDINFKTTRLVVQIYENVLAIGLHVVGDIVASGLVAGLLFRVGKGKNTDKRFLKLVVHFIYLLLVKVAIEQPSYNRPMSVISMVQKPLSYARAGSSVGGKKVVSSVGNTALKTDIRTISNKFHAQDVTELLIDCLENEDYEIIKEAMTSLATMQFSVIKGSIINITVLNKLALYATTRQDCFFSGLDLICDVSIIHSLDF
jgi:hypothetical protein